jgi:hypothetical protein
MRPLTSWLLLFLIAFQWMAGHLVVETLHVIEVQRKMDQREAQLAEALKASTGASYQVAIIEEDFHPALIGYSSQFILSEEIGGETVHYKIAADSTQLVEYLQAMPPVSDESNSGRALLDQLFSKFRVDPPLHPFPLVPAATARGSFFFQQPASTASLSLPDPPPIA